MPTMPVLGTEVELEVTDLNSNGGAVARREGLVYFLDRALPGAVVRARVKALHTSRVEAVVLGEVMPSPWRSQPFCEHFGACGGCVWQDLEYEEQIRWKKRRLESVLRRIAGVEAVIPPLLPSPAQRAFRNKVEYAFGLGQEGEAVLGLRLRGAHTLLPVESCALQSAGTAPALAVARAWMKRRRITVWNEISGCLRYLVLRETAAREGKDPLRAAELICGDKNLPIGAGRELWAELEKLGFCSLLITKRLTRWDRAQGEQRVDLFGAATLVEYFGALRLEFPIQAFLQTNTAAAELLYQQVKKMAALTGRERVWDIYAGVGSMGLFLADGAAELLGVELEKAAVEAASMNAAALGLQHCCFSEGDAAKLLPALKGHPDLVIVDPPRAGLAAGVLAAIKTRMPARLIYVSCDPAAFARDLRLLAPEYRLEKIQAVDMFPHTPHVESASLLLRRP